MEGRSDAGRRAGPSWPCRATNTDDRLHDPSLATPDQPADLLRLVRLPERHSKRLPLSKASIQLQLSSCEQGRARTSARLSRAQSAVQTTHRAAGRGDQHAPEGRAKNGRRANRCQQSEGASGFARGASSNECISVTHLQQQAAATAARERDGQPAARLGSLAPERPPRPAPVGKF